MLKGNIFTTLNDIDIIIENRDIKRLKSIKDILMSNSNLLKYFYDELSKLSDFTNWFVPLFELNYFDAKYNLPPQTESSNSLWVPRWEALAYLLKVSDENKILPNPSTTETLISIVDDLILRHSKEKANYHTERALMIIISSLPADKINDKHIAFIREAFNNPVDITLASSAMQESVLPEFLSKDSKDLLLKLLDVFFDYKAPAGEYEGYESIMENYWFNEALNKHKVQIAGIVPLESALIVMKKIKAIISEDNDQFNQVWIPTIEDHEQTGFPDRYECQIVYFFRDMLEVLSGEEAKPIVESLLGEAHPIFKRIAVHIINRKFDELRKLLFSFPENPLEIVVIKHELFELFKNHAEEFSKEELDKIISWIETVDFQNIVEPQYQTEFEAKEKKEWYLALLDSNNPEIESRYEENDRIYQNEIDHPGFDIWSGPVEYGERSPIKTADLLAKTNAEIADYLSNFQQRNEHDQLSEEGLASSLEYIVRENANRFLQQLQPFITVKRKYQASIIRGLSEAWKLKKEGNWAAALEFIKQIIGKEQIWQDNTVDERYNYKNWIIRSMAEFISNGTKDDDYAFEPELFPVIEKILLTAVDKVDSGIVEIHDLVTSVLNSAKGEVYTALINYSLRWGRVNRTKDKNRWKDELKEEIAKRIDPEKEKSPELWVTLGKYLPNILWLDDAWAKRNINRIFPIADEKIWGFTMTGYLFFGNRVYEVIYKTLRENLHYKKAITMDFGDESINERVVSHVCMAYKAEWEKLSDPESLINQLINNENAEQYRTVAQFFLGQDNTQKLKPLWAKLHPLMMKNIEQKEYKTAVTKFALLLEKAEELDDDIFEWIKAYIPHFQRDWSLSHFVTTLDVHLENSPKKTILLLMELAKNNIFPEFKKDIIIRIVASGYKIGMKEITDQICNLYAENGLLFLRDSYEEYNSQKQ